MTAPDVPDLTAEEREALQDSSGAPGRLSRQHFDTVARIVAARVRDAEDWAERPAALGDHPHVDPGDGRTECYLCGKFVHDVTHSCKGVPVTRAAEARVRALIDAVRNEPRVEDQAERIGAAVGERIAQQIEAARDKLHPAFSGGDANLPRGYTNAARIARAAVAAERERAEAYRTQAEELIADLRARLSHMEAERDEWKRRRDRAIETCRFRHQDGLTAEEWHTRICGAIQGVQVERERADAAERERDAWKRTADERSSTALAAKIAAVEALADEWDRLARQHRTAAMRDSDIERDWIAADYASKASDLRVVLGERDDS